MDQNMSTIDAGKTYLIRHSRKGTFAARVVEVRDEWADVIVVAGKASAAMSYNEAEVGDALTVRRSFCTLTEQPQ